MNALEKVVDLLIAVILMFLIPLLFYSYGKRISQVVFAGQTGENFLHTVSTAGEITQPVWSDFEKKLKLSGCVKFELQRDYRLFEPGEEKGSVVMHNYTDKKGEIAEEIAKSGKYRLRKGDCLKLTMYLNDMPMVYCEYVRTGAGVN